MGHKKSSADEFMEYMIASGEINDPKYAPPPLPSGCGDAIAKIIFILALVSFGIIAPITITVYSLVYGSALMRIAYLACIAGMVVCGVLSRDGKQRLIRQLFIAGVFGVVFCAWFRESAVYDGKWLFGYWMFCLTLALPCWIVANSARKRSRTASRSDEPEEEAGEDDSDVS